MDNVIKHLSVEQLEKISRKDKKVLFEIQKDIHAEKAEYYNRLKTYYWVASVVLLLSCFLLFVKANSQYFLWECLGYLLGAILFISGSKIYIIDKSKIVKKAIAKSKSLDAMEIEAIPVSGFRQQKIGLAMIALGTLIYICIIITIFIT